MFRKFSSDKDKNLLADLPFKYESSTIYLDFAGYVIERNGESNLAVQDVLYPNDFPYLYLPKNKENWPHSITQWITKEELATVEKKVKVEKCFFSGKEFYYKTTDFIELTGGNWAKFRKDVHKFTNDNKFQILDSYPETKVKAFLDDVWLAEQKNKTASFAESYNFFLFCLKNREKYGIKILYVQVDDELAGLAMGAGFNSSKDKWLALHIKVDYTYRGLSKFIYHERAKLFSEYDEFTSGSTCAGDGGIEKFKNSLNPCGITESYYLITGDRL
jgi:hypothetical protein